MQKYILLIDDDEEEHLIFSSVVESMKIGYSVLSATNPKDGLDILLSSRPAIIFLDLNMPVDGFECLRRLNPAIELYNIPVFFYSNKITVEMVHKATEAGASGVLEKKYDVLDLKDALAYILEHIFEKKIRSRDGHAL